MKFKFRIEGIDVELELDSPEEFAQYVRSGLDTINEYFGLEVQVVEERTPTPPEERGFTLEVPEEEEDCGCDFGDIFTFYNPVTDAISELLNNDDEDDYDGEDDYDEPWEERIPTPPAQRGFTLNVPSDELSQPEEIVQEEVVAPTFTLSVDEGPEVIRVEPEEDTKKEGTDPMYDFLRMLFKK